MKKALGILAVITSATAFVAYKLKKDEKKVDDLSQLNEDDISERILKSAEASNFVEEEFDQEPARETHSYPYLNDEDMLRLNALSEENFATLEEANLNAGEERPLQHRIVFAEETDLENYKNIVINEGYVVTLGEHANELIVLNISATSSDAILQRVYHLANVAKQHHGEYQSWILK